MPTFIVAHNPATNYVTIGEAREGQTPDHGDEREVSLDEAIRVAQDVAIDWANARSFAETKALREMEGMEPSATLYEALRDKWATHYRLMEAEKKVSRIQGFVESGYSPSDFGLRYDIAQVLRLEDPMEYAEESAPKHTW
jgi:hypothetical protein